MANLSRDALFAHLDDYATQTPERELRTAVRDHDQRLVDRITNILMMQPIEARNGWTAPVTMDLPAPAREVLERASDAAVFEISRRGDLLVAARVAREASQQQSRLDGGQTETLASAAELLLGMTSSDEASVLIEELFGQETSPLSTWTPDHLRWTTQVHLIPCWLAASWCSVSISAVGFVALLETLARVCIVRGVDGNQTRWLHAAHERAHPWVVNGVAGYVVDTVLETMDEDPLKEQAQYVVDVLEAMRPLSWTWWKTWGAPGTVRPEDVRAALMAVRSLDPEPARPAWMARWMEHDEERVRRNRPGGLRRRDRARRAPDRDDEERFDVLTAIHDVRSPHVKLGIENSARRGLDVFAETLGVQADETIVAQMKAAGETSR